MSLSLAGSQPTFADVDSAGNAAQFVDYLDNVRAMAEIQRIDQTIQDIVAAERPGLIVEIGCGTGDLLGRLVDASTGAGLGIEKSADLAAEAQRRHQTNPKLDFMVHDLMTDPVGGALSTGGYGPGSADVVLLNRVVQHLADPVRLLENARSLLRRNGLVVLSDVDWTQLSINHPDEATTARVLAEHVASVTTPRAGAVLGRLLGEAGFERPAEALRVVHRVGNFAVADGLFRLTDAAMRLVDTGAASADDIHRWLDGCRHLDRLGCFAATISQSIAVARA